MPLQGPAQKLESFFFDIFCGFELCRDRQCHGTRNCPRRLSSDKLLRVAVPNQLRVSLHARRRGASRMRRNCGDAAAHRSTHNTQAPYTHTYQHQQQAHQQSSTPQKQNMHQAQHGGGRRRRCAWRPCRGWPDFSNLVLLPTNLKVQLMISNFLQESWQQYEHTFHIWEVHKKIQKQHFSHLNGNVARLEAKKKNLVESSGATDWLA